MKDGGGWPARLPLLRGGRERSRRDERRKEPPSEGDESESDQRFLSDVSTLDVRRPPSHTHWIMQQESKQAWRRWVSSEGRFKEEGKRQLATGRSESSESICLRKGTRNSPSDHEWSCTDQTWDFQAAAQHLRVNILNSCFGKQIIFTKDFVKEDYKKLRVMRKLLTGKYWLSVRQCKSCMEETRSMAELQKIWGLVKADFERVKSYQNK